MKEWIRSLNPVLAAAAVLLFVIGLFCLASIAPEDRPAFKGFFPKQAMFGLLGISVMVGLSVMHFSKFERSAYILYALSILVLLALLTVARPVRGVRAWFSFGGFTIQPSEFVKIVLVIVLARYVSRVKEWTLKEIAGLIALASVPIGMVVVQPDLGMCIVMSVSVIAIMVAGRVPWKVLGAMAGAVVLIAPFLFMFGLKEYQRQRILALVVPGQAARGMRDQQDQALRLFASGGPAGLGLGEANLSPPYYLPERHNDFIGSVVGEEMGFIGLMLLLALYGSILWVCLRGASRHRDPFPRVTLIGLMAIFFMQVVSNLGMTMSLLPVTGLTLPFLSYGGSSLLASFATVGLMLSVVGHWKPAFSSRDIPDGTYALELPRMR